MRLLIRPLTAGLWPALEDLFGSNGACRGCWCMYWRIGSAYRRNSFESNRAAFCEVVTRGPPPGLLAFDGEVAVGWCQLTPRDALPGPRVASQADRRRAGVVAFLSLRAQRPSPTRGHGGADRRGRRSRPTGRCPRARSLPPGCRAVPQRDRHRLCLDFRAGRFPRGGPSRSIPPDHAPRPSGDRSLNSHHAKKWDRPRGSVDA